MELNLKLLSVKVVTARINAREGFYLIPALYTLPMAAGRAFAVSFGHTRVGFQIKPLIKSYAELKKSLRLVVRKSEESK